MPTHPFEPARGRTEIIELRSEALRDNLLGDPAERQVAVYLPPEHTGSGEPLPLFVDLVGFTGSGFSHLNWKPFHESLPQRLDRLVADGRMGPVVLALPDCFTSLGGNQYIDSLALGRWEQFLIADMLPAVEQRFGCGGERLRRAVFGKSSGGYGALVHAMRHADVWGAAASHSGDVDFELAYRPDFPRTLAQLAKHGNSVEGFLEHLAGTKRIESDEMQTLMMLAMAASYDPDPLAPRGIHLPVDLRTGQLDERRWANWLRHDPLRIAAGPQAQSALRSLAGLYVDCGSRDQYNLQFGTRALVDLLERSQVPLHHEEFDDTHSGIDYRMDQSLPWLYRQLEAARR